MHRLLQKHPIISDQITKEELDIVLKYAEETLNVDGDFVEFGCYSGTTSLFLSRLILTHQEKRLWVYDSFEGLPEKSNKDESPAGFAFKQGELSFSKKQFIQNYKKYNLPLPIINKGWFRDLKLNQIPSKIAFAFLDGDYYDSIYDSFNLIKNNLDKNSFVLVHDYDRSTLPGVRKAINQILHENNNIKLKTVQQHIAIVCNK